MDEIIVNPTDLNLSSVRAPTVKGSRVYILTWCKDINQLYGSLLTFKTIRTGFPNSEIVVFDNCSIPAAQDEIKKAADAVGAVFHQLEHEVKHHDFIRWAIFQDHVDKQLVFADGDLIFWDDMENTVVDGLMAGRLIPLFGDKFSNTKTMPRLHTSLVMIPDPGALAQRLHALESEYFEADLIRPTMLRLEGEWLRWDTLGTLYGAITEQCTAFDEALLNRYDHIFCGSHLNKILSKYQVPRLAEAHHQAMQDYTQLKGIWHLQEQYFKSHMPPTAESKRGNQFC